MDVLTKEECQAIIDHDHTWETVDILKQTGGQLKFHLANFAVRSKKYPVVLKECVMRYEVGDYAQEHTDSYWRWLNKNYIAYATWITPLNKGYEGGDLYVDGKLVEQVVGTPVKHLITTPHEITEITKGTRYSLVSWFFTLRGNKE